MRSWTSKAIALATSAALSGCVSMPDVQSVESASSELTGIGEPFEFSIEREPLDAADNGVPNGLTLESALRLALKHSPTIQSALARVRQAEAEAKQSRLLPNPILSLAIRFSEDGGKPDIEASVAADLLSLLLKPGRISAADQRLRKATSEALVVVLDTLLEVQEQYTKVQALSAAITIDESRKTTLTDLVGLTEARLKAGESTRLDVLTIQTEQADLDTELLLRRSEERQARIVLARLIGTPSANAAWTLETWVEPNPVVNDEAKWMTRAVERRPEINVIRWELAALGDDLSVARFAPLEGGDVGIEAERDESWSIGPGASIPIPIFDMGQAERERLQATIVEQRHELTRTERLVVQEVRIALEQLRTATSLLQQIETSLRPLQEQRLTQAQNAYRSGLADVLAVRLAEQDLQATRAREIDLQAQVSIARFQLQRAVGGLIDESVNDQLPSTNPTE